MRTLLLLAAVLATPGCYGVDNCNHPAEPFTLDEDLDEAAVKQLILENHVIAATDLECKIVCESLYLDRHEQGGATRVDNCTLELDGNMTGDPTHVLGNINCNGRGIPQFCTDD